jgi:hypothetical protein
MKAPGSSAPAPVFATHHGIEYPGEMVRVRDWEHTLAEPLAGDAYFRVVFLESQAPVPSDWQDPRIAVSIQGERTAALERAERELRLLRSTGGGQIDSDPFDPLTRETQEIENWAVGAWTESFTNGRLYTAGLVDTDLTEIFRDGYWSTWAERIGQSLLRRTYQDVPVRADLLKIPLRPEADVPILFEALMTGDGVASSFALDAFGPGLALTSAASPRSGDLSENEVARRLSTMVADGLAPDHIGHALAHGQGLTYPLATLYLLLWIREGKHVAHLRPAHGLMRRDDRPHTSDMLSFDDLPSVRWPTQRIWRSIASFDLADSNGQSLTSQER